MSQLSQSQIMLKGATRKAIEAIGGVEAAAHFVRVNKSQLGNYYSPNHPDCFAPLDVAIALDELAGYPHITEAMNAAARQVVAVSTDPHTLLSCLLKGAGEVGAMVSEALSDGRVCPREATDIIKEATDLKEACQRLIDMASSVRAMVA